MEGCHAAVKCTCMQQHAWGFEKVNHMCKKSLPYSPNCINHLCKKITHVDKVSQRFLSLDVFRGMTICFMIIVNTPGSGATPFAMLEHAAWHGFTPTDLVFPSFLFAVGNAMSFSMKKFIDMENSRVLAKIFKRSILIFLIGYLMYWFPFFTYNDGGGISFSPIENTRILGVLQRIGLCYLIVSLLIHYLNTRAIVIISIIFLLGYWIILMLFGDVTDPLS